MDNAHADAASSFIPEQIASMLPDLSPITRQAEQAVRTRVHEEAEFEERPEEINGSRKPDLEISNVITTLSSQMQGLSVEKLSIPLPARSFQQPQQRLSIKSNTVQNAVQGSVQNVAESTSFKVLESSAVATASDASLQCEFSSESHISEYFDYLEGSYHAPCDPRSESVGSTSNGPVVELPERTKPLLTQQSKREEEKRREADLDVIAEFRLHGLLSPKPQLQERTLIEAPAKRAHEPAQQPQSFAYEYKKEEIDEQINSIAEFKQRNIAALTQQLEIYKTELPIEVTKTEEVQSYRESTEEDALATRLEGIRERVHRMERQLAQAPLVPQMPETLPEKTGTRDAPLQRFGTKISHAESPDFSSSGDVVEVEEYYISSGSNPRASATLFNDAGSILRSSAHGEQNAQSARNQYAQDPEPDVRKSTTNTSLTVADLALQREQNQAFLKEEREETTSGVCVSRRELDLSTLRQRYEISKYKRVDEREEKFMVSVRNFQQKLTENKTRCATPSQRAEKIRELMRE